MTSGNLKESLPPVPSLVAVCAHPDDESFGLGGILGAFAEAGTRCSVLCFTNGEASTLGADEGDLAEMRPRELAEATEVLGVSAVELLDYPDGGLAEQPLEDLAAQRGADRRRGRVARVPRLRRGRDNRPPGSSPGHGGGPRSGRDRRLSRPRLGHPDRVAEELNSVFGASFVGRSEEEVDIAIRVDRARQRRAMACHRSQALNTPVPWRRLELTGEVEWLRYLRR